MKKALPLIIGVILFALLLMGYWMLKQKNEKDAETVEDTLYTYAVDDISQFSFLNTNGDTLSFTRTDDGWVYDDSDDYQISEEKVTSLLNTVASLTLKNTLQDISDLEAYGLATPLNRVSFTVGDTAVVVCIGNYNTTTESQYIYLNDDTSVVYAVQTDLTGTFQTDITELVAEEDTTEDTESTEAVESTETTEELQSTDETELTE